MTTVTLKWKRDDSGWNGYIRQGRRIGMIPRYRIMESPYCKGGYVLVDGGMTEWDDEGNVILDGGYSLQEAKQEALQRIEKTHTHSGK
jgi:hypothetical protein